MHIYTVGKTLIHNKLLKNSFLGMYPNGSSYTCLHEYMCVPMHA